MIDMTAVSGAKAAALHCVRAAVVGTVMTAAGKAAAVTGTKTAPGTSIIIAVEIATGRTGIPTAPAGHSGAVGAVTCAKTSGRIGQLRALSFLQQIRAISLRKQDGGLRRV